MKEDPCAKFPADFEAGKLAFAEGLGIESCPYPEPNDKRIDYQGGQRQSWLAGYLEAEYFEKYWRRNG